jgi:hypothetical protein
MNVPERDSFRTPCLPLLVLKSFKVNTIEASLKLNPTVFTERCETESGPSSTEAVEIFYKFLPIWKFKDLS